MGVLFVFVSHYFEKVNTCSHIVTPVQSIVVGLAVKLSSNFSPFCHSLCQTEIEYLENKISHAILAILGSFKKDLQQGERYHRTLVIW